MSDIYIYSIDLEVFRLVATLPVRLAIKSQHAEPLDSDLSPNANSESHPRLTIAEPLTTMEATSR